METQENKAVYLIKMINSFLIKHKKMYLFIVIMFLFLSIVFGVCYADKENISGLIISTVFFTAFLISLYMFEFPKMLTKLSSFMAKSILLSFIFSMPVIMVVLFFIVNQTLIWLIFCISFTILQILISLMANNDVATLGNEIYSVIFAILSFIKDVFIEAATETECAIRFSESITISGTQVITSIFDFVVLPLLISNSFATLACLIKKYLTNKKVQNEDLTASQTNNAVNNTTENTETQIRNFKLHEVEERLKIIELQIASLISRQEKTSRTNEQSKKRKRERRGSNIGLQKSKRLEAALIRCCLFFS